MGVAHALHRLTGPAVAAVWLAGAASASALPAEDARHLLSRSGFGATPADVAALAELDRVAAVAAILDAAAVQAAAGTVTAPPPWTEDWAPPQATTMDEIERLAGQYALREQGRELKGWWLREMLATPAPLTEVMTLFWHNHFTSSLTKVQAPTLLFRQNALLRHHALGNFATLLHAVARDPAMLLYLDNTESRKQAPNENFAREMMELFTLGEGRYSEADVKEAARSFTGWSVDADTGEFRFRAAWHDGGSKMILGRSGVFSGATVIELLLARPETAELVVTKLWRHLISEQPDPTAMKRLAALFREGGYEIKPLLAALFGSDAFWAPENRGRLVKPPVDLVVGTLRLFDLPVDDHRDLAWVSGRLGQDLFDPPDVKGWPGGTAWITGATLLDRQGFLDRLTGAAAGEDGGARAALFDRWVAGLPERWRDANAVTLLLLPVAPVDAEVLDRGASGAQLRSLLADPAYQLK